MTFDELERLVREAIDPRDIFGDDIEGNLPKYLDLCRPDRHPGQESRAQAVSEALRQFARFTPEDVAAIARAEAVFQAASRPVEPAPGPPITIRSPKRAYVLLERIAVGDVADVHLARGDGTRGDGTDYVLKVARIPEAAHHLETEREALAGLLQAAGDCHYRHYFPTLAESFPVRDRFPKRVNVYLHRPGLFTLEQVHGRHPALGSRHLAWIFKRLLTALGFAHRCGRIHGAVVPAHVLIHAESHGLLLVGWGHSVREGQLLRTGPARYLDWYPPEVRRHEPAGPATDIYLAARCLVELAGGDPAAGRMPDSVPAALAAFVRSCLLEGPRMRPDDAWGLLDELDELLRDLYGPPRYHRLVMP
jgi:hypothetical protein